MCQILCVYAVVEFFFLPVLHLLYQCANFYAVVKCKAYKIMLRNFLHISDFAFI